MQKQHALQSLMKAAGRVSRHTAGYCSHLRQLGAAPGIALPRAHLLQQGSVSLPEILQSLEHDKSPFVEVPVVFRPLFPERFDFFPKALRPLLDYNFVIGDIMADADVVEVHAQLEIRDPGGGGDLIR